MLTNEWALLRCALQTGTPLGNERFKAEIEAALDIKAGFARRGTPDSPQAWPGGRRLSTTY